MSGSREASVQWKPEWDAMLRENFDGGMIFSYADIASVINKTFGTSFTRNATIGRGSRLGLVCIKKIKKKKPKTEPKPKPKATQAQRRGLGVGPTMSEPQRLPVPVQLRCDPLKAGTFDVTELEEGMCKWPTGEGAEIRFCGLNWVDGMPYCGAHCQIAFQPAKPGTRPSFQHRRRA